MPILVKFQCERLTVPKEVSESKQATVTAKKMVKLASEQLLVAFQIFATFPLPTIWPFFASPPSPPRLDGQRSIEDPKSHPKSCQNCEKAKLNWDPIWAIVCPWTSASCSKVRHPGTYKCNNKQWIGSQLERDWCCQVFWHSRCRFITGSIFPCLVNAMSSNAMPLKITGSCIFPCLEQGATSSLNAMSLKIILTCPGLGTLTR